MKGGSMYLHQTKTDIILSTSYT